MISALGDLRHCAASLSLAAGLSMKAIPALLGHSSYQLTADTYTSLLPQFEQAAANAPVDLVPRRNGVEKPSDQQATAAEGDSTQSPTPVPEGGQAQQDATPASVAEVAGDRHLRVVRPAPRDEVQDAA
ncbi:hypothetical protein SSP24_33300 [Streptomyces spinoverrucosus]|uniref:Tyr recombinase domain-containing protein n=1 Tax=Streptomyces spinoverrucosus TaxID=284043 RepID=A0A4Y3VHM1_9ACTN|nr:hypothetical protein [Streptomyces spinoverrucosus]GEC05675.1 hypothetical protein SSP24_33300 [Streptomyces spinoverrucosus]GHB78028.1 hypothetical protein GCM10010397_55810 [Streptomyces spinoverrucosus]